MTITIVITGVPIYRILMVYVNVSGYVDTTEEALSDALQTCLNVYNIGTSQKLELVFFKQAIRHAARFSRVLVRTLIYMQAFLLIGKRFLCLKTSCICTLDQ